MIKGLIFDLDGTTLDTLEDIKKSLNIILEKNNIMPVDREKVRLSLGRGSRNLIKDQLPKNTNDNYIDDLTNQYLEIYSKNYNVLTKPYNGIYDLLIELQNKGYILAVNSNKPNEFCKNLMEYHFPKIKFISIIGARPGISYKPDPYSANEIVEKMGFKKEEVLYVGDSENDVLTAKNANLKAVGCLWGFRDLKTLEKAGADIIISEPKELLNYLN